MIIFKHCPTRLNQYAPRITSAGAVFGHRRRGSHRLKRIILTAIWVTAAIFFPFFCGVFL